MKSFDPKIFMDKSGNFSDRAGMAGHCKCGPQESLGEFQKFFLLRVPIISWQYWKAKLERVYSFRVQSGKMTQLTKARVGKVGFFWLLFSHLLFVLCTFAFIIFTS